MKKAWIFLIALALLAFSVPVFAQAPAAGSFHAWNQGNLFPYYAVGSNTATWGWGPQWDALIGAPSPAGNAPIDQEWTFSYDGNNYGFSGTFEFGGGFFVLAPTSASGGALSWFNTYYKFGDIAKFVAGRPRFNDYTEFSQIEGNNYKRFGDSDYMAILQLFPVPGASIAGAFYVPYVEAAQRAVSPDYANNFGLAASYAVPNMASVKVMLRMNEGTPGDTNTTAKLFSVGVNYSGMKGLVVNGDLQADFSSTSNTVIKAFVSASTSLISPVSLAVDFALVNSGQALTNYWNNGAVLPNTANFGGTAGTIASGTYFAIEGDIQYTVMAPWNVGVTVGYDTGTAWFNQGVGDWDGFELWPYVRANFDNGSYFKAGFMYASGGQNGSPAVIAIPIYYVWSF